MSGEVYSEWTGNPFWDNAARRGNAHIRRIAKAEVHITGTRSRKRKKHIVNLTRRQYIDLLVAVSKSDLTRWRERRDG